MIQQLSSEQPKQEANYFIDRFEVDRPSGQVIGRSGPNGILRQGVDKEGIVGIDNSTLRIEPLIREGWGRAGLVYGPYKRENGLIFAVSILNGHNTSQAGPLGISFKRRMVEWAMGSHSWSPQVRLAQWVRYRHKLRTLKMWRRWWNIRKNHSNNHHDPTNENLVLGWFPNKVPEDPRAEGNAFIVHATNVENGELWVRSANEAPPLIRGLQNIPLFYFVVLREQGAAYYAAAVPDIPYLPAYPYMRPLAIDPFTQDPKVYAGFFQGASGQIGFRADTLVRDVQVTKIQALSTWYGTAHGADKLIGEGHLEECLPEKGIQWVIPKGVFRRTPQGCKPEERDSVAILETDLPTGLIHVLVRPEEDFVNSLQLIWRYLDQENYWAWEIGETGSQLLITFKGRTDVLARESHKALTPNTTHSLQILDNGNIVQIILNGQRVFNHRTSDTRLQEERKVGVAFLGSNTNLYLSYFEVHPRSLRIPVGIDLRPPWTPAPQRILVAQDCFDDEAGDLDGRITPLGDCVWQKAIGTGVIELNGKGCAAVRGNPQQPNPGRTVYTIPWSASDNADLELEFIPPGDGPGQWQKSRAGVIFFQDENNYISVSTYVDDYVNTSSVAFFYCLSGFEEIYDAIWSNVGRKITWGTQATVRVVIEGVNLAVFINGEAVLYRSLTDVYPDLHHFDVRRVGIVINWEWGNDTGTILRKFVAAKSAYRSLYA